MSGPNSLEIMFRGDARSLAKAADKGADAMKRLDRATGAAVTKVNELERSARKSGEAFDTSGLAGLERMKRYLTVGAVAIRLWAQLTAAIDFP